MRTPRPPTTSPLELLQTAVQVARRPGSTAEELDPFTAALARQCPDLDLPGLEPLVDDAVHRCYDRGWQPADLVHVTGRRTSRRAARLVGSALLAEAERSRAADRAPREWVEQLATLPGPASGASGWWARSGLDAATGWRDLVRVLALLTGLPALQALLPGPAAWPRHHRATSSARPVPGPVDEKVLGRVRGLLAKAERTEFAEEADALTAKAQELMSRYAIDHAVLAGAQVGGPGVGADVVARRLHLTDPFTGAKAALLHAVADPNGCQVVLLRDLGIATVVGLPVDVALVELLFTSLLLQATRALSGDAPPGTNPSPVYKRGFLLAYATRIGERLTEAGDRATAEASAEHGRSVLPVLARRQAAVADRVTELFPHVRRSRRRTVDPEGWWAGRRAADTADLGAPRTPLAPGPPPSRAHV
ncbi:Protein of unknown function [Klenkia marina]|uniref:DUF2786 domain-containing protein n=1 Tax=Klenkia marina TaxID=1960309 RepID=A0A1G4X8K9_9ACTN|nr:DUF2786 domain-containing protein [Klenkia marina]SCX37540.1 Protein of unknown function [Klenkia marina]